MKKWPAKLVAPDDSSLLRLKKITSDASKKAVKSITDIKARYAELTESRANLKKKIVGKTGGSIK